MFRPLLPRGGDFTAARFPSYQDPSGGCSRNQIALIRVLAASRMELSLC
jgi:hypothetical protein